MHVHVTFHDGDISRILNTTHFHSQEGRKSTSGQRNLSLPTVILWPSGST
jgi:hypothetical protein